MEELLKFIVCSVVPLSWPPFFSWLLLIYSLSLPLFTPSSPVWLLLSSGSRTTLYLTPSCSFLSLFLSLLLSFLLQLQKEENRSDVDGESDSISSLVFGRYKCVFFYCLAVNVRRPGMSKSFFFFFFKEFKSKHKSAASVWDRVLHLLVYRVPSSFRDQGDKHHSLQAKHLPQINCF